MLTSFWRCNQQDAILAGVLAGERSVNSRRRQATVTSPVPLQGSAGEILFRLNSTIVKDRVTCVSHRILIDLGSRGQKSRSYGHMVRLMKSNT